MKVPFTWKVTGWFMIGWSAEFRGRRGATAAVLRRGPGRLSRRVRRTACAGGALPAPRRAHRTRRQGGRRLRRMPVPRLALGPRRHQPLHPLSARPPEQGAAAARLPGARAVRLRLRVAPTRRQGAAVGDCPTSSTSSRSSRPTRTRITGRTRSFRSRADTSPVHPQIVAENGPDSAHFHYVHGATVTPVCLNWEAVDEEWRFLTGWPDARSDDPDKMALLIHSHFSGLGFAISAFEGSSNHRLIFACTPVEDGYSDMFYSIWWPRAARRHLRRAARFGAREGRAAVPRHGLGGPRHLALPGVRRAPRAVQDRRETLYGHA